MSAIFKALVYLFSPQNKKGVAKVKETALDSKLPSRAPDSVTSTTSGRFPVKLFNIDIDIEFPPVESTNPNPLLPQKGVSEVSFLNDYIEPNVDLQNESNADDLHQEEESPEILYIIQMGIRDFQTTYLQKIEAAFHIQLEHVTKIFRKGLETAHSSIELQLNQEMSLIRNDYKNRIAEFEASTAYYHAATADVIEENRVQAQEMAAKIQVTHARIHETDQRLKADLEKKLETAEQKLRDERSRIKLEFHEKVMAASNTAVNGRWVLEEKLKLEVRKQEKTVETLRVENDELKEKIDITEIHLFGEFNRRQDIRLIKEHAHHDSLDRKNGLEKKIEILQQENLALVKSHKVQIAQVTELHDLRDEHYKSECRYFHRLLEETRATFHEDITHLKESTKLQEEAHETALENLHDAYREKLVGLLDTVHELKANTQRLWGPTDEESHTDDQDDNKNPLPRATPSDLAAQLEQLQAEVSTGWLHFGQNGLQN